jgi:hypothetical protein
VPLGGQVCRAGASPRSCATWSPCANDSARCAWRITANDLTGITGPEENEKGLEDARRALLLGDGTM